MNLGLCPMCDALGIPTNFVSSRLTRENSKGPVHVLGRAYVPLPFCIPTNPPTSCTLGTHLGWLRDCCTGLASMRAMASFIGDIPRYRCVSSSGRPLQSPGWSACFSCGSVGWHEQPGWLGTEGRGKDAAAVLLSSVVEGSPDGSDEWWPRRIRTTA